MLRTFVNASMVFCLAAVPEVVQEGPPSTGTLADRGFGPAFQGIGDLPGGSFHSEALTISENGRTVAGRSSSQYSEEEGLILTRRTEATSISANGHVVVGNGTNPSGQTEGWIAFLR